MKTFKIRLQSEAKDEHLKMNLLYHVPMSRMADVIDYLEKVAPRKKPKVEGTRDNN